MNWKTEEEFHTGESESTRNQANMLNLANVLV